MLREANNYAREIEVLANEIGGVGDIFGCSGIMNYRAIVQ